MTDIRLEQAPAPIDRKQFGERFRASYTDPAYRAEDASIARMEIIAWSAYTEGRKTPLTSKAGTGYADPNHDLSVEWVAAKARIEAAQARQSLASTPTRALLVCGSARNDGGCPGEMSRSFRLVQIARKALEANGVECDVLDLSLLTSEYRLHIHPCKGCASTAMPLCHWPCSCYPNHALGQTHDWMAEIYERWTAAHAVLIVTPVYWQQSPSPLKLMIDRLVCADGGNPDPTSTGGKQTALAKRLEMSGWDDRKHLAGRAYGVVVHGDSAGIEGSRRSLCDWLDWMGFIDARAVARLDRHIGQHEPGAMGQQAAGGDVDVQEETRLAAQALGHAVAELRGGRLPSLQSTRARPRPK